MAPGEFDLILGKINKNCNYYLCLKSLLSGFIARIHGLNAASVFANNQSINNSWQQMKHDINKKGSSTKSSKRRASTTTEQLPALHDDENNEDDDDDEL